MKGDTLETIDCADCRDMVDKYGWPWYLLHRVDLHNELRRLAGGESSQRLARDEDYRCLAGDEDHRHLTGDEYYRETGPTRINLAAKVVEVDCELGVLRMADGSVVHKDLIVAADGVHSSLSSTVIGTNSVATPTGSSMFRFLVPTEKLVQSAETRSLVQGVPPGVNLATGLDRRIVWYPCRGGELQNFGLIHPDTRIDKLETDWTANASLTELVEECRGFHPSLRAAMGMAEDIKLWKLLYRPPTSSWTRGKVVLIGDAAHPMLPNQGQGGAQAIEDGAALGLLLSNLPDAREVPRRLKLFQEIRKTRAAAMQIFSNAGQDEAEKIQKEARAYVKGPIPSKSQLRFFLPTRDEKIRHKHGGAGGQGSGGG